MSNRFRILIAPLDWGLGHASRCIPLIRELLKQDFEPILGGTKESLYLLKQDFPDLESIELPPYNAQYSENERLLVELAFQFPRFLLAEFAEKRQLKQELKKWKIDAVISDNRYGLYSKKIPCVFICHQLTLHAPALLNSFMRAVNYMHRRSIQNFDECWVPDYEGENALAGELSRGKLSIPLTYLGPLSRFSRLTPSSEENSSGIDVLIVLSGPEPQRSLLEEKLLEQIPEIDLNFLIVQGKVGKGVQVRGENFSLIPFMNTKELKHSFQKAQVIISRSGYSSLMDYEALGLKKLILIPTPGQPEQEYLGERWAKLGKAVLQKQDELNLEKALKAVQGIKASQPFADLKNETLEEAVRSLKETIISHKSK